MQQICLISLVKVNVQLLTYNSKASLLMRYTDKLMTHDEVHRINSRSDSCNI